MNQCFSLKVTDSSQSVFKTKICHLSMPSLDGLMWRYNLSRNCFGQVQPNSRRWLCKSIIKTQIWLDDKDTSLQRSVKTDPFIARFFYSWLLFMLRGHILSELIHTSCLSQNKGRSLTILGGQDDCWKEDLHLKCPFSPLEIGFPLL